ncbi:class II fumarate hydratase [Parahaliea sp. F7430]|uniref:Fumarate hydratase class II n=1 Tax=Sediminihaliea albiluteola TaxID=2758564 RepID=A0A7W2TX97_9GAMM|nr:class II fumarate hydratase [Sediminihaliea albiluteola]MBA6413634.1 class II fumarate hydratase [Sediminihaliea albiluteola]
MSNTRIETDSMGQLEVPEAALYGAQTQRAVNNFPISGRRLPQRFIRALLLIKQAAATANVKLGELDSEIGSAIVKAVQHLQQDPELMSHFPVDVFQTGSGTSSNMNANEVIASLASQQRGAAVHPNDHVNRGQSSNDVIPTAIHLSAILALEDLLKPALEHLVRVIEDKAQTVHSSIKTGRTHLMDAMPVRMSDSLSAWATQMQQNIARIKQAEGDLRQLAQGGTAVGSGINAHPQFAQQFCLELSELCQTKLSPSDDFFAAISSQDAAVALSGQLRCTAVSLTKIANDLRWMNSGPLAGIGEIELQALQPGSSIMPGKVNPVLPEAAAMVAAQVIGNDASIAIAGQSGNFELNVMLPLIADRLMDSIELLANTSVLLADKAIATFTVNDETLKRALARNPILVTALNPVIGYQKAAAIAKQAYQEGRPIIDVAEEHSGLSRDQLKHLLDPATLADGSRH